MLLKHLFVGGSLALSVAGRGTLEFHRKYKICKHLSHLSVCDSSDSDCVEEKRHACEHCISKEKGCQEDAGEESAIIECLITGQRCYQTANYNRHVSLPNLGRVQCTQAETLCTLTEAVENPLCVAQSEACRNCSYALDDCVRQNSGYSRRAKVALMDCYFEYDDCFHGAMNVSSWANPLNHPALLALNTSTDAIERRDHPRSQFCDDEACFGAATTLNSRYEALHTRHDDSEMLNQCSILYQHCMDVSPDIDCKYFLDKCNICSTVRDSCLSTPVDNDSPEHKTACTVREQLCYLDAMLLVQPKAGNYGPDEVCSDANALCFRRPNDLPASLCTAQSQACKACVAAITDGKLDSNTWATCFSDAMTLNGTYTAPNFTDSALILDFFTQSSLEQLGSSAHRMRSTSPYDCQRWKVVCDAQIKNLGFFSTRRDITIGNGNDHLSLGPFDSSVICDDLVDHCFDCVDIGQDSTPQAFGRCLIQELPSETNASFSGNTLHESTIIEIRSATTNNCTTMLDFCNEIFSNSSLCSGLLDTCLSCESTDLYEFLGCMLESEAPHETSLDPRSLTVPRCNCTNTRNCLSSVPNQCSAGCATAYTLSHQDLSSRDCCVDHAGDGKLDCSLCHPSFDSAGPLEKRIVPCVCFQYETGGWSHCCTRPEGDFPPPPSPLVPRSELTEEDQRELAMAAPMIHHKFDPTINILGIDAIGDGITVNCALASRTCLTSPFMDPENCAAMIRDCYKCASAESMLDEQDSPPSTADELFSVIATVQVCYHAVFSPGTTFVSNSSLGYSCDQAQVSCKQQAVFNADFVHEGSASLVQNRCRPQHDACKKCQVQEKSCLWTGDKAPNMGKAYCSAEAAAFFYNAMTFNGTCGRISTPFDDGHSRAYDEFYTTTEYEFSEDDEGPASSSSLVKPPSSMPSGPLASSPSTITPRPPSSSLPTVLPGPSSSSSSPVPPEPSSSQKHLSPTPGSVYQH